VTSTPLIEIDHVTFGYGSGQTILNNVSLSFPRGKATSILGSSGCGKTTLLRLIGGVHAPDRRNTTFDGEPIDARAEEALQRMRRRMGFLFQFGALFTDLSMFDNVAFPLRDRDHEDPDRAGMRGRCCSVRGARQGIADQA
jgi:phospholipid/cholesterol/gamma-HCH transport system ATP-binding protein